MQLRTIVLASSALILAGAAGFAAANAMQEGAPPAVKPGEQHKWLASHVGTWDATIHMGPGEPDKGTSKIDPGPGGLWFVSHFEGSMMGGPFQGQEVLGYDTNKGKFVSVWVDSMGSNLNISEGTYDAAKKTLSMTMDGIGPDGKPMKSKNVTTYPDANTMVWTMTGPGPDGKDMEHVKIEYKRRK